MSISVWKHNDPPGAQYSLIKPYVTKNDISGRNHKYIPWAKLQEFKERMESDLEDHPGWNTPQLSFGHVEYGKKKF
jgi:hypothetical protein